MNDPVFVANMNGQETLVRMTNVVVPGIRVSTTSFGILRVAGGVPGPPGTPGADTADLLDIHIADLTPHPAYDDLPSMTLLFENGLI